MPADGLGLVRQIRQEPALTNVAIVVVSAQLGQKARWLRKMAGADAFFLLSAPPQEIVRAVRRAVTVRERRASTGRLRPQLPCRNASELGLRLRCRMPRQRLSWPLHIQPWTIVCVLVVDSLSC